MGVRLTTSSSALPQTGRIEPDFTRKILVPKRAFVESQIGAGKWLLASGYWRVVTGNHLGGCCFVAPERQEILGPLDGRRDLAQELLQVLIALDEIDFRGVDDQ